MKQWDTPKSNKIDVATGWTRIIYVTTPSEFSAY